MTFRQKFGRQSAIRIESLKFVMSSTLLLLVFSFFALVYTERNFRFFIENFEFENADWQTFKSLNSQLVQLNNRSYMSGSWSLHHSVTQFDIRAFIDLLKSNKQRKRIFEVRVDGCMFLKRDHKSFLFKIVSKTIRRHVSANLVCPLESVNFRIIKNNQISKFMP